MTIGVRTEGRASQLLHAGANKTFHFSSVQRLNGPLDFFEQKNVLYVHKYKKAGTILLLCVRAALYSSMYLYAVNCDIHNTVFISQIHFLLRRILSAYPPFQDLRCY